MIVLISRYDHETGALENVRRDLTKEECMNAIQEYNPGEVVDMTFPYNPDRPGLGQYKVSAAAKCWQKDPVVLEARNAAGTKYAFRGTTICCEVDSSGKESDIKKEFLADQYPIEPAYLNDTICIPSVAEWNEIPESKRILLSDGLWCWSRDIKNGEAKTIWLEGTHIENAINNDSGGVVAFVDLRRLPGDVAYKIRASEMHDTSRRAAAALVEDTVCFEEGNRFTMVKMTEDVFGICATCRSVIFGVHDDLRKIDRDISKTYEESELRAHLNGEYLEQLIKYIREH